MGTNRQLLLVGSIFLLCMGGIKWSSAQIVNTSRQAPLKTRWANDVSAANGQEAMVEQEGDWVAAHESNGPEGAPGVPMHRISPAQIGLVMLVLAASGGLAFLAKKTNPRPNHQANE